jgi:hypothetical protein
MAFTQLHPGSAGFTQLHPENAGFQQLHDSTNPAAQAYARMALARNGIHVGPGEDAAAMWRQFSAQRASAQAQAAQSGPDPYEAGVNPNQPLGGPTVDEQPQPSPPVMTPGEIGSRLPDGGFRHGMEGQPFGPNMLDWHTRIAQMANHLSSANMRMPDSPEFHAHQGGPAESALQIMRMHAVGSAHNAAKQLAKYMSARRPSQLVRRTHDPVRF